MKVLYITSGVFGLLGTCVALAMMSVKSALDAWWSLAAIFSGGMLGLFLLGYMSRKVKGAFALTGVISGVILIAWISFSKQTIFHNYMTIVLGTLTIFIVGMVLTMLFSKKVKRGS